MAFSGMNAHHSVTCSALQASECSRPCRIAAGAFGSTTAVSPTVAPDLRPRFSTLVSLMPAFAQGRLCLDFLCSTQKAQKHSGTVDDGIKHVVLNGGSQAGAARTVDCCPMALSRAISALKDAGARDEHVADIVTAASPAGGRQKGLLDMPSPGSLGQQIKGGATRLGDGRPYGGKGNTWGEYREVIEKAVSWLSLHAKLYKSY